MHRGLMMFKTEWNVAAEPLVPNLAPLRLMLPLRRWTYVKRDVVSAELIKAGDTILRPGALKI
jgi:hypothetical protein